MDFLFVWGSKMFGPAQIERGGQIGRPFLYACTFE